MVANDQEVNLPEGILDAHNPPLGMNKQQAEAIIDLARTARQLAQPLPSGSVGEYVQRHLRTRAGYDLAKLRRLERTQQDVPSVLDALPAPVNAHRRI